MNPGIEYPENLRAALYIRLSREDESDGPSQSVTNQKAMLEEFARLHRICVQNIYIDDGWSGTNFDRPAFNAMIRDIREKRVNLVITKDLSRLGRDYIMTGYYMERYFPEKGVRYISLLDGIDTGVESSANDITPFRAIMNDMYAKDISKKIRSVKRARSRQGLFIGGKAPYGYLLDTDRRSFVIDEPAAGIVRRIFKDVSGGVSCRQIAARLTDESVPTPAVYARLSIPGRGPYSGQWSSEQVSAIARNETYLGHMVQGKSERISYKSRKSRRRDSRDWIVVENTHLPLVDRKTFDLAQCMLAGRRQTRSRSYDSALKGLCFCRECGYPLTLINRKNKAGEDVLYFLCRTWQRQPKSGVCSSHCVKTETLEACVRDGIEKLCSAYLRPDFLLPVYEQYCRERRVNPAQKHLRTQWEHELELISGNIDTLYQDRLRGVLKEEDFTRIYESLQIKRRQVMERLSDCPANPWDPTGNHRDMIEGFCASILFDRAFLVRLIERVELSADKQVRIRFRIGKPESD